MKTGDAAVDAAYEGLTHEEACELARLRVTLDWGADMRPVQPEELLLVKEGHDARPASDVWVRAWLRAERLR